MPAYSYAILASDATTTMINYPSYSGIVIDTAMSLGNTSETLKIIDANGAIIDTAYSSSMGANGDGKTLQKVSVSWVVAAPTLGAQNAGTGQISSSSSQESSSSNSSSSQNSSVSSFSSSQTIASGSVDYPHKNEQISAKAGRTKQPWRARILF